MVHQIQPVHLLDADDHDPEVLPCNGVVEIGDILAQFEVWIVGVLGDGVPWGWVFERACGFFFFASATSGGHAIRGRKKIDVIDTHLS